LVVLGALLGIAKKHNKKYCWVSQKKLGELVGEFGGIWMSNRTLNRDLRFLEDDGWIQRVRRITMGDDGRFKFRCTLYKFKAKVFNTLFSIGNAVKRLFSHYRLPRWAEYQLYQKQVSSRTLPGSVEKVLIKERDGTIAEYDPSTGEYLRQS
jgi:hypothetical protein